MRGSDYARLEAFGAVVEHRNFRRAARQLRLSPSALSRAVQELEDALNVKLLHRTTRSVAPTDAGERLYARVRPALSDIERAMVGVAATPDRPAGTVRINTPKIAADLFIVPRLSAFRRVYPGIALELAIDDDMTDIVAAGFDAGIRSTHHLQLDMIAVPISGALYTAVVGAPAYFEDHPKPTRPTDLVDHDCINYRWRDAGHALRWPFADPSGEAMTVDVEPIFLTDDAEMVRAAACHGVGLAVLIREYLEADLASGRLVEVLSTWRRTLPGFSLYYPNRRHVAPAVRAVIDFFRHAPELDRANREPTTR